MEKDDGKLVADAETHIKTHLNNGVCPKELLPDGYTETYEDTPENLEYMVNYLKETLNTNKEKQI